MDEICTAHAYIILLPYNIIIIMYIYIVRNWAFEFEIVRSMKSIAGVYLCYQLLPIYLRVNSGRQRTIYRIAGIVRLQ